MIILLLYLSKIVYLFSLYLWRLGRLFLGSLVRWGLSRLLDLLSILLRIFFWLLSYFKLDLCSSRWAPAGLVLRKGLFFSRQPGRRLLWLHHSRYYIFFSRIAWSDSNISANHKHLQYQNISQPPEVNILILFYEPFPLHTRAHLQATER